MQKCDLLKLFLSKLLIDHITTTTNRIIFGTVRNTIIEEYIKASSLKSSQLTLHWSPGFFRWESFDGL